MKKIIIYFLVIFLTTLLFTPLSAGATAETGYGEQKLSYNIPVPTKDPEKPINLKDYTFDLSKTLKTDDQKQEFLFGKDVKKGEGQSPLVRLLLKAINILTYTIGSLAFVALILSGLWLVTSHGEQSQIEKGKKIFTYALIGLGFAFCSYIIITFVQSLLK